MSVAGYGIDFGTTNSAIAIAYDDNVSVLNVEPGSSLPTMLPSMVYLHRDRNRLAGSQAAQTFMITGSVKHRCASCELVTIHAGRADTLCRTYMRGGGCLDARLLAGLKLDLANETFTGTHSWAVDFNVDELVGIALRRLKALADSKSGEDVRRVVCGYPFAFPDTEGPRYQHLQTLAWHRLEDAALAAGFEEVVGLPEPHAAAIVEESEEGTVLALDFGGGTFDVAVIEFSPSKAEVTALQGASVGGARIDEDIFRVKVADALGLSAVFTGTSGARLGMPALMQRRFQSLSGIKHLMASNDVAAWLREHAAQPGGAALKQLSEILYGGQAYAFYRAIEQAKIDLSDNPQTLISFHRSGIDVETPFARAELDEIVNPYLRQIDVSIDAALAQAGVLAHELSYVITTGGSSQLASFQDHVASRFGSERIMARDPYNTVVTGLAYEAQNRWAA